MNAKHDLGPLLGAGALLGVGMWALAEYSKKEPVQYIIEMAKVEDLRLLLLQHGFCFLSPLQELTRKGKVFSMAKRIENNREIHVRVLVYDTTHYYLSAHEDYRRDGPMHLLGLFSDTETSYRIGKTYLAPILQTGGLL